VGFSLVLASFKQFGQLRLKLQCFHLIAALLAADAGFDDFVL